jgi:hypothetical protein
MVVGSAPVSVANPTTKFDAGASYPAHDRPAGEEVFALEGEVDFGRRLLSERKTRSVER